MLKIYVDEKEHNAEIEVHGDITTLATDTTFAIMQIYQEMLEGGREDHAHAYRDLLKRTISHAFDEVDRLYVIRSIKEVRYSEGTKELLEEIMKRRG